MFTVFIFLFNGSVAQYIGPGYRECVDSSASFLRRMCRISEQRGGAGSLLIESQRQSRCLLRSPFFLMKISYKRARVI